MMARTVLGAATVCSVEGVVGGRTRSGRGGLSFVQAGVSDSREWLQASPGVGGAQR